MAASSSTLKQYLSHASSDTAIRRDIGKISMATGEAFEKFREICRLQARVALAELELADLVRYVPADEMEKYLEATSQIEEKIEEFISDYVHPERVKAREEMGG